MGEIMRNLDIEQINKDLKDKSPIEIIAWANSIAENALVTTNFRPNESYLV